MPPAAAAAAWAERARAAGAELRIGVAVEAVEHAGGRVTGVRTGAGTEPAGAVAIAAGPWTRGARAARPIAPLWGVNVEVRLPEPPRHVLEQAGIDALTSAGGGAGSLFSIVTAGGVSAVGSTFLPEEPDPAALAPLLLERGARFLPALARAGRVQRPRVPAAAVARRAPAARARYGEIEGLHVASGHGAWGISLGPGSAELVAAAILGDGGGDPARAGGEPLRR